MEESIRLGRIRGISVGINWSVLLIFALVAFGLAAGRFPLAHPGRSTLAYAAAGIVAAVIFFGSLLAHELAHAIVAERNGLDVDGITLWLFGGVARLGGEAADPGAELRISGVGPLVSLVLAALFGVLALLASGLGFTGLPVGVVAWLGIINLVLGIFNLVPAAPLDGGRLLRAFLWRIRGDRHSASITAARAGRVFGFVLVGLGLLEFVLAAGFGGLWLVLIGWFLITAARAEEQHAQARGALGDVRVGDLMSPDPETVPADLTVEQFLDTVLFRSRWSSFPLVDEGRPTGLITLNRVKQVPKGQRTTTRLRDIACGMDDVAIASPEELVSDLLPRLGACADGRALVLTDSHVAGIVSPSDVARHLERADLREAGAGEHV